jgi:acyl transferase domain-containing protein
VIVEEAPPVVPKVNVIERPWHILTLSAKTEGALQELVGRYRTYLEGQPEVRLADVAYTANVGRSHFKHRLAVMANDTAGRSGRVNENETKHFVNEAKKCFVNETKTKRK